LLRKMRKTSRSRWGKGITPTTRAQQERMRKEGKPNVWGEKTKSAKGMGCGGGDDDGLGGMFKRIYGQAREEGVPDNIMKRGGSRKEKDKRTIDEEVHRMRNLRDSRRRKGIG